MTARGTSRCASVSITVKRLSVTLVQAQRSDYTAIGPTVNLASRIESAAEPGGVFVSAAIAREMGEGATAEVGAFELKGIEGQVTLHRLIERD